MRENAFIDTNILVYAKLEEDNESNKNKAANELLKNTDNEFIISVQVLNEFSNVLLRHKIADKIVQRTVEEIIKGCVVVPIDLNTVLNVWKIKKKYGFSYWDSMIVSSALESHCTILYSEDMQNGQIIEKQLKIINPFFR
jgi:predicted nucleic acid-binding protein